MNLNELQREVEDKAVEHLNATRLDALEEMALNQLNKTANNGYVRLNKLEFSALLNAVRGLQRKRQQLEADVSLGRQMVAAIKHSVVATVGGVDYEGNPTSEINYLQRLRILVEKEKSGARE